MKKRILSLVLAVLMILSTATTLAVVSSAVAYTDFTLAVEIGTVDTGTNTVDVNFVLYNNPGINGIDFRVNFDKTKVKLASYEEDEGDIVSALGTVTSNINSPGAVLSELDTVTCVFFRTNGTNTTKNGTVMSLTFDVLDANFTKNDFSVSVVKCMQNIAGTVDNADISSTLNTVVTKETTYLPEITGVTFADGEFTYDGTEKSIYVSGATNEMNVVYSGNGQKNAASHTVTATVTKAGFAPLVLQATLKINPKNVTVSGLTAQNRDYDGTNVVTLNSLGVTYNGVVANDSFDVEWATTATTANANAGSNKAVDLSGAFTVTGADKGNYILVIPTVTVDIDTLTLVITPNDGQGKRVGENDPAITYTTSDAAWNSTLSGALSRESGEAAGSYKITMGTLATSNANIELSLAEKYFVISSKNSQTVNYTQKNSMTYGDADFDIEAVKTTGSSSPVVVTSDNTSVITIVDGDKLHVVGVGTATITVSSAGDASYSDYTTSFQVTVSKKQVVVTPSADDIVYGETPVFNKTYSETIAVKGELALDNYNAGTRKIVIGTLASDNANYELVLDSTPVYITVAPKKVAITGVTTLIAVTGTVPVIATFNPTVVDSDIIGSDVVGITNTVGQGNNVMAKDSDDNWYVTGLESNNSNYVLDTTVPVTFGTAADAAESAFDYYYVSSSIKADGTESNILSEIFTGNLPEGITLEIVASSDESVVSLEGEVNVAEEDTDVVITVQAYYNGVAIDGATQDYTISVIGEKSDLRLLVYLWIQYLQSKREAEVASVRSDIANGSLVAPGTKVTLSTDTAGATIYYTLDGSEPSVLDTIYTKPITVTADTVIKAIAVKTGMKTSAVAKFEYTVSNADTVISLKDNAASIKYMDGRTENTFAPEEAATRYEVIKALANVFNIKTSNKPVIDFNDVAAEYKDLVDLFTAANIINGYPSDSTFRGEKTITRAEFCKIICIMLNLDTENAKAADFNDVEGHWAEKYINACANASFVEGKGEGRFAPDAEIKRAEIATLINRITGAQAGTSCAYTDVAADAWYFGAVAAAAK